MANEPRSYREVIAEAARALRPRVRIVTVEPAELEGAVEDLRPHMVVGNRVPAGVRDRVAVWVELYPGHGPTSLACVGGECSTFEDMQLPDLLNLIDETDRLAQRS
jgi:hypothetical protein